MKKILIYLTIIISIISMLVLGDESKKPIMQTGPEMIRSAGTDVGGKTLTIDESAGYSGLLCRSNEYILNRGNYEVKVDYQASQDSNYILLMDNGIEVGRYSLASEKEQEAITFQLEKDSQSFQIMVFYSGEGTFTIVDYYLLAESGFYADTYFLIILFVFVNILLVLLILKNKKTPIEKEVIGYIFLIGAVAIYATVPFMNSNLLLADDLCYHLMRIEGIKDGILEGQIPVMIHPENLKGNGYLNIMYPFSFLYIPAVLRIMGVSLALAYKFTIFTFNIFTAVVVFFSVRSMTNKKISIVLVTVLYTLLPYRITNIYARGALGEVIALTFLPLILAGCYQLLIGNHKKWYYLVIGFSGLIHSHVLSAVLMGIFCFIAGGIWFRALFRENRWLSLLKAIVVTVLLNLWYIIGFLYYYLKEDLWTTALGWSNYYEYSLNPSALIETFNFTDHRILGLGLPIVLCSVIALVKIIFDSIDTQKDRYLLFLFIMGVIFTFMTTGYFPSQALMQVKVLESFLKSVQFPWRLLAPAGVLLLFAGGIWISETVILKEYKKAVIVALIAINMLSSISLPYNENNFAYADYTDTYSQGHENKIIAIPKVDATIVFPYEWRITNTTDDLLSTAPVLSNYDTVNVAEYEKDGTKAHLTYSTESENQFIEFPTQAYIGYHAYNELEEEIAIIRGDGNRIRVSLNHDGEEHTIRIQYETPEIILMGLVISCITILVIVVFWAVNLKNRKGNKEL